jgi:hypothetical protein
MTAAEYAAHAEKVDREKRPTEVKTLKSGSVFLLRRPDIQRMVELGVVPQSLLDEGLRAWEKMGIKSKSAQDTSHISIEATKAGLELMREVVADVCVMPPFNEITARTFLREDFEEIYEWAMKPKEGPAVKGLRSFRERRKGGVARDKPDSEKLQPETVSTAAH